MSLNTDLRVLNSTITRKVLMECIRAEGPVRPKIIAENCALSSSSVAYALNVLGEHGFTKLVKKEKKVSLYQITEKGKEALRRLELTLPTHPESLEEYKAKVISTIGFPELQDHIAWRYQVSPSEGLNIEDVAGGLARYVSVTSDASFFESSFPKMSKHSAKILILGKDAIEIHLPLSMMDPQIGSLAIVEVLLMGDPCRVREISRIKLLDIEFPTSSVKECGLLGPGLGIDGINEILGKDHGPILSAIIQPNVGLKPEEFALECRRAVEAGADFVCDDEILINPSFCGLTERVQAVVKELAQVQRSDFIYFVNFIGKPYNLLTLLPKLKEIADEKIHIGFHTTFPMTLSFIQELRETLETLELKDVPIFNYLPAPSFMLKSREDGVSALVWAKLTRIVGADIVYVGGKGGRFIGSSDEETRLASDFLRSRELTTIYGKPSYPAIVGGINPCNVIGNLQLLGPDVVVHAASGIYGVGNVQRGIEAFKYSFKVFQRKITIEEAVNESDAFKQAWNKWGTRSFLFPK